MMGYFDGSNGVAKDLVKLIDRALINLGESEPKLVLKGAGDQD